MDTAPIIIDKPVVALVMFGPPTNTSGFRAGEYCQCTIDPNMCSPSGEFIRLDQRFQAGSELHGWQRVEALTVCEVLGDAPPMEKAPAGYQMVEGAKVTMRALCRE